jgi:hypothetical protein
VLREVRLALGFRHGILKKMLLCMEPNAAWRVRFPLGRKKTARSSMAEKAAR